MALSVRVIVIFSAHKLLWWDSYKGVGHASSSPESILHKIIVIIIIIITPLYAEAEGIHQHGLRRNCSTPFILLELQSSIATGNLDQGLLTACYSVDMSAAFDVLGK